MTITDMVINFIGGRVSLTFINENGLTYYLDFITFYPDDDLEGRISELARLQKFINEKDVKDITIESYSNSNYADRVTFMAGYSINDVCIISCYISTYGVIQTEL